MERRWGLLAIAAGAWVAGSLEAATITSFSADVGAFSPNGDGVADSLTVAMTYETTAATLDSLWIILPGDELDIPIYVEMDVPATGEFMFTWGGDELGAGAVPDSSYTMRIGIATTDSLDTASLTVTVDSSGPEFASVELTGPPGGLSNGDFLQLRVSLSEPADSLWLDVSSLDDDASNHDNQFFDEIAPTEYAVLYRISDANTVIDRDGIAIRVSARDSLGNEAEATGAPTVCLSNAPPIADDAALFDPAGADTLAPGFAYTTGDTITVLACFFAPFDTVTASTFTYFADFSPMDTEFNPFLNPAMLELEVAVSIPDTLGPGPRYTGHVCATLSYVLSEENATPDGTYEIVITATDGGCGEASVSVLASLADLGPVAPVLDTSVGESVSSAVLRVSGVAEGAFRVEILDADTREVFAEATPDSMSGAFAVDVMLRRGLNRFVAVAYDEYRHASPESNVIEVTLATGFQVAMPDRFYPGDGIEVAALDDVSRYDLDIFNLAGDRVHRETVADPGAVHAFTWNGRNRAGSTVGTGPYVVRITRHTATGTDVITRAFVFTRK